MVQGSQAEQMSPPAIPPQQHQIETLEPPRNGVPLRSDGVQERDSSTRTPVSTQSFPKVPGIDITPTTPGTTPLKETDKPLLDVSYLPKPEC